MKARTFLFSLFMLFASSSFAQNEPSSDAPAQPRRNVQVDPLTTLLGFVHLQVEWISGSYKPGRFSIYAGPSLYLFDSPITEVAENFRGIGAEFGGRWYFLHNRRSANPVFYYGPWILARGVLARVSIDQPEPEAALGGYGSLLIGQTFLFRNFLILSVGAGGQLLHYTVADQGIEGFLPAAHTTIGFAF